MFRLRVITTLAAIEASFSRKSAAMKRVVVLVAATTIGIGSALSIPLQSVLAQGSMAVGAGIDNSSYIFYGNQTYNRVIDAIAPDLWVNSIYVDKDNFNGVEVGWSERPSDGRNAFGAWKINGVYGDQSFFAVSPNTDHNFMLRSQLAIDGTKQWVFRVDGSPYKNLAHNYLNGRDVRALQERNTANDDGTSHFWSLMYRRSDNVWVSWSGVNLFPDNDSEYLLCLISSTEFWVKPVC